MLAMMVSGGSYRAFYKALDRELSSVYSHFDPCNVHGNETKTNGIIMICKGAALPFHIAGPAAGMKPACR